VLEPAKGGERLVASPVHEQPSRDFGDRCWRVRIVLRGALRLLERVTRTIHEDIEPDEEFANVGLRRVEIDGALELLFRLRELVIEQEDVAERGVGVGVRAST